MLLRQMEYFVKIAECGSFTEAAEQCFISQSAVSQQISALEDELGVTLIRREGRKISLTAAGEYFYRKSRAILAEVENLREETVRIGSDGELSLRIGFLSGYEGAELQNAVVEFARIYPEEIVSVFRGTHEELYRALRSGKADIVLSDQRRAFSDEYENFILCQTPAVIELSASHPLAGEEVVSADRLSALPCILVAEKGAEASEQEFYENTLGIGRQFLFAASLDEARLMAMGGRGFLWVESIGRKTVPPLARLEIRRADGSPIVRTYCAFWQKRRSNYYIEEFACILRDRFSGTK